MGFLERLIGFLPVILLFVVPALIGLRRAARRRRRARAEAAGGAASETGAEAGPPPRPAGAAGSPLREAAAAPRDREGAGSVPRPVAGARLRRAAGPTARQVARTAGPEVPAGALTSAGRERYVYPPPLPLDRLHAGGAPARAVGAEPGAPRPTAPGGLGRPLSAPSETPVAARSAGRSAESAGEEIWRRLSALPPLQRAIVFAEILGSPRALAGPGEGLAAEREI